MPRRRKSRVYAREYAHGVRYWGDFRDFADVGGSREPLVPDGADYATDDPDVAAKLAAEKLSEYESRRRSKTLTGIARRESIGRFAVHHVDQKRASGKVTRRHLGDVEQRLRVAVGFFGPGRLLDSIGSKDVERFLVWLRDERDLSAGTRKHYLNALSNLYRRAVYEEVALRNPAAAILDKPSPGRSEARWMEHDEAAVFLEAARLEARAEKSPVELPIYPIVATFLLTGARRSEVYGLDATADLSFDGSVVRIRPNRHRRIKTATSRRTIPLWPQLREILADHLDAEGYPSGLLFRSPRTGKMITDERKALDTVTERAVELAREHEVRFTFEPGEVRTKVFRHTYTAARLQTLDRGEPVSIYTVTRELGHGSTAMVERVYAHLGTVRHRAEVVEYRLAGKERVEA